jgi:hypothetical protein
MLRASMEGDLQERLEVDVQTAPVRRPEAEVPFSGQGAMP